jgi:uncharacterized membrane protein YdbT with pleckstrin-like domain
LRYEDIRGVEIKQSLLDRILIIGDVVIGSAAAAQDEGEILLRRISNPQAVQLLLQKAIDRKKRSLARSTMRGSGKGHQQRRHVVNGGDD